MIDNLKNIGGSPSQLNNADKTNRDVKASKDGTHSSGVTSSAQSEVELSSEGKKLDQVAQSMMSTPEVDEAKVESIKAALANGDYKIDFGNLAKKMVDSFGQSE